MSAIEGFLRRVVGLNWSPAPYRAVAWVDDGDRIGAAALSAGLLAVIVIEDGGALCRITSAGLDRIGARLPFVVRT